MHSSLITPLDLSLHDLLPLLAAHSIAACCGVHSSTPLCFHEGDPAMPDDLQLLLDNLDAKARELVGADAADRDYYDAVEQLAFQELDARWLEYADGELEAALRRHLAELRERLGIDLD